MAMAMLLKAQRLLLFRRVAAMGVVICEYGRYRKDYAYEFAFSEYPNSPSSDYSRYKPRSSRNWGVNIVPEKTAYIVERLGKYQRTLNSGIHILIPFVDRISYVYSLEEKVIPISHCAITKDKVPILVDVVLGVKIVDPVLATYAVDKPIFIVIQQAREMMMSELRKITFDEIEAETLKENIV